MIAHINKALNFLRKHRKHWTATSDRDFHDQLFAARQYQPFSFSYYGYVTIRRFADLAQPFVEKAKTVLDLGCGPAEITCELARRLPHVSFLGVDHSRQGIARAKNNAMALQLQNIEFQVADSESFEPPRPPELITMFDSFHHLANPGPFLARLQKSVSRFLLIEPRGDWKGSHVRDYDFDWVVADLEKIRRHLALKIQEPAAAAGVAAQKAAMEIGAALENRYHLHELQKLFKGFGLYVRGTVSGLEKLPPDPYLKGHSREFFGKKAYEIFTEIDALILENQTDLLAKHWLIFASRELPPGAIRIPRPIRAACAGEAVQGPYDVEFLKYDGPLCVAGGSEFRAQIEFLNRSYRTLSSLHEENPDFLSYHWLDWRGTMLPGEGLRTPLVKTVAPGEKCKAEMRVAAPARPGKYVLAIDMVQEGKNWYSVAGNPCLRMRMKVKKG